MAERTNIEWCDSTFNAWTGCEPVSPGCLNCYAAQWAKRAGRDFSERMRTKTWGDPIRWNAKRFMQCDACGWRGECAAEVIGCGACGQMDHLRDVRRRVFVNSLADVFDNQVPALWRQQLLTLVADTPNLDWIFLTKRIGNAARMLSEASMHDGRLLSADDQYRPPANLWIGATVVSQEEADRDVPKLMAVPARVRFLSMEPLLQSVAIWRWLKPHCERHPGELEPDGKCEVCEGRGIWGIGEPMEDHEKAPIRKGIDWVIVGGESGPGARPMHPDWVRSLRDQCGKAGVPFLFKQWGEWAEEDTGLPAPLVALERDPEFDAELARHDGFISLEGHFVTDPDDMVDGVPYRGLMRRGKKAAGRLLDGVQHTAFPMGAANV